MSIDAQWLNVQDVAELLQIKQETVRRWIRRNELPVLELGGPRAGYRVRREDLNHFIWQRYRMRRQHADDRSYRREFDQSDERVRALESVSIKQESARSTEPDAREYAYVSLLSRIPGITYIAPSHAPGGDTLHRNYAFVSQEFQEITGATAAHLRQNSGVWWDMVHEQDVDAVRERIKDGHDSGTRYSIEYRVHGTDGIFWVRDEAVLSEDLNQWQGVILNISDRKRIEASIQSRINQHAAIVELGDRALGNIDSDTLIEEAVNFVHANLEVDFTKVLQLLPGGDELVMRAGIGWRPGMANRVRVSAGAESQAGYTLLSNEPVIVDNLNAESRFNGPPLLKDHGVQSGISVIIAGHGMPWGVFGAHTSSLRTFTRDDVHFLQSVANVLAAAFRAKAGRYQNGSWLSIRDVANSLQITEETVRRWIRRGELPIIDLGSSRAGYRIHPADLEQFIGERYLAPAASQATG